MNGRILSGEFTRSFDLPSKTDVVRPLTANGIGLFVPLPACDNE